MSALQGMIADAAIGKNVYISRVHESFAALPMAQCDRLVLVIDLLSGEGSKAWELRIPRLDRCSAQEKSFVRDYFYAETYNILSSIGARVARVSSCARGWISPLK